MKVNRYIDPENGYIRNDLKLGRVELAYFEISGRLHVSVGGGHDIRPMFKRRFQAIIRDHGAALAAAGSLEEALALIDKALIPLK